MSLATILFSSFVGFMSIILFPAVATWIYSDTDKESDRRSRLNVLRMTTLVTTTGLGLWTYFWVVPYGDGLALDAQSLTVFVFFGAMFLVATTPLALRIKKS